MLALLAALPAGCAVRGDVELLESELRRQEQVQQQIAEELKSTREDLRVARTDAENLRVQLSQRGQHSLVSEQAEVLYKTEAIRFNAMLTSGANRDGQPGDEGISVLLQPVDAQGDLVKLVGDIDLELLDLSREGDSQRVGHWHFTSEEVREHWHRGFVGAGYLFQLEWQTPPVSAELTLHGKMTAPDGRRFDTTAQVKVEPTGAPTSAVAHVGHSKAAKSSGIVQAAGTKPAASPKAPRKLRQRAVTKKPAIPKQVGKSELETSDNFTDETIPRLR